MPLRGHDVPHAATLLEHARPGGALRQRLAPARGPRRPAQHVGDAAARWRSCRRSRPAARCACAATTSTAWRASSRAPSRSRTSPRTRRPRPSCASVYGSVDDVEFYVGLIAEDTRPNSVLGAARRAPRRAARLLAAHDQPAVRARDLRRRRRSPSAGCRSSRRPAASAAMVRRNIPSDEPAAAGGADAHGLAPHRRTLWAAHGGPDVILFLHNRYRTTGGEERVVDDLLWLAREHLGEDARAADARQRDDRPRAAPPPGCSAAAWRPSRSRPPCATAARASCTPTTSTRRSAGARWRRRARPARGRSCTCTTTGSSARSARASRAARTAPAAMRATRCPACACNCRGTGAEAAVYGASLALWQRRIVEHADAVVVPSAAALARLRALGAPLDGVAVHVVGHAVRAFVARSTAARRRARARRVAAGAGEGRRRRDRRLRGRRPAARDRRRRAAARRAGGARGGHADDVRGPRRRGAARATCGPTAGLAIVPSRSAETFGLAAAEAMAAGLPVVASAIGALPELCEPAGPRRAGRRGGARRRRARALRRRRGRRGAGGGGSLELAAPAAVAPALRAVYDAVLGAGRPGGLP